MNTVPQTPKTSELQEQPLHEPSGRGAAWAGIALVAGVTIAAIGLWFLQGDDAEKVQDVGPDPRTVPYDRPAVSPTGPYPAVEVDLVDHRFGVMELGGTGAHTYVVTNNGEADLILKQGPKSCACTRYDIEKTTLAKGESGKIHVEWMPKDAEVQFLQSMNLYTNDPENTVIPLTVAGSVAAVINIIPKGEWDIGSLSAEKGGRREGVIASAFLDDFEITDIETSDPALTVELKAARTEDIQSLDANHGVELHAVLATNIPAGPFKGTVTFKLKDHPDREYTIDVKAHRDGSINFLGSPSAFWDKRRQLVDLGQFSVGTGKTGQIFLYLNGQQEISAGEVSASPGFINCELKKDPTFRSPKKTRYILSFEVPAGSPAGGYKGRRAGKVSIKTDHPEYPVLNLRVQFVTTQ